MKKHDRVQYVTNGPLVSRRGALGTITDHKPTSGYVMVRFDGVKNPVVVDPANLLLLPMAGSDKNYRAAVRKAVKALYETGILNRKDTAVRRLGVALALAEEAERERKRALRELKELGIQGDDGVIFDGEAYQLSAEGKGNYSVTPK